MSDSLNYNHLSGSTLSDLIKTAISSEVGETTTRYLSKPLCYDNKSPECKYFTYDGFKLISINLGSKRASIHLPKIFGDYYKCFINENEHEEFTIGYNTSDSYLDSFENSSSDNLHPLEEEKTSFVEQVTETKGDDEHVRLESPSITRLKPKSSSSSKLSIYNTMKNARPPKRGDAMFSIKNITTSMVGNVSIVFYCGTALIFKMNFVFNVLSIMDSETYLHTQVTLPFGKIQSATLYFENISMGNELATYDLQIYFHLNKRGGFSVLDLEQLAALHKFSSTQISNIVSSYSPYVTARRNASSPPISRKQSISDLCTIDIEMNNSLGTERAQTSYLESCPPSSQNQYRYSSSSIPHSKSFHVEKILSPFLYKKEDWLAFKNLYNAFSKHPHIINACGVSAVNGFSIENTKNHSQLKDQIGLTTISTMSDEEIISFKGFKPFYTNHLNIVKSTIKTTEENKYNYVNQPDLEIQTITKITNYTEELWSLTVRDPSEEQKKTNRFFNCVPTCCFKSYETAKHSYS